MPSSVLNNRARAEIRKAYIKTKSLFHETLKFTKGRTGWDRNVRLSEEIKKCLNFCILKQKKGLIEADLDKMEMEVVFFSDASATGEAAFRDPHPGAHLHSQTR